MRTWRRGVYTFKICGQVHHAIGCLLPSYGALNNICKFISMTKKRTLLGKLTLVDVRVVPAKIYTSAAADDEDEVDKRVENILETK